MTPTHCISCGSEVPDHAKFCQACGSAVYRPEDTSQSPKPAPAEAPVPEVSSDTEPNSREPLYGEDAYASTEPVSPVPETSNESTREPAFLEAISSGFSKYAVFSGRALRSEYWYWSLFTVIANILAMLNDDPFTHFMVVLILVLPNIAVTARRLHDVGRSGWWQLIALTGVGVIPFYFWLCKRGDAGENRYGLPVIPALQR